MSKPKYTFDDDLVWLTLRLYCRFRRNFTCHHGLKIHDCKNRSHCTVWKIMKKNRKSD